MVFLNASNGDLTAVLTNVGHARLSVPLYHAGSIQSTLTYSFRDDQVNVKVTKLLFVGTDHLVAVLDCHACVVWNVLRGVMVHTIAHEQEMLDVAASQDCLYILVASNAKLQLHEYAIASGKLVRKIKAGSVHGDTSSSKSQTSCCVSGDAVAVRNGNVVKVLQLVDGAKVYKCKLPSPGSGAAVCAGIVMDATLVATAVDSGVVVFRSGKQVATCALPEPPTTMQLVGNQVWMDDAIYTLAGSSIAKTTQVHGPSDRLALIPGADMTTVQAIVFDKKKGVSFHTVSCVDGKGQALSKVDITYEDDAPKDVVLTTKRPADSITTTLGPGQAGGESMLVNDERPDKRAKAADVDLDEPTIAERLKRLSDALEDENDDADDGDDDHGPAEGLDFLPKKATTESLAQLLHQALSSGDDPMLELALGVRDKTVMATSLKELEPEQVSLLLTKLTMRLANKPTRAGDLVPWIASVLTTGMIRNATQLRPLRNLLQERVESFPHLLQLEGRLSMLASM
jgi:hypothetical protein